MSLGREERAGIMALGIGRDKIPVSGFASRRRIHWYESVGESVIVPPETPIYEYFIIPLLLGGKPLLRLRELGGLFDV